MMNIPGRLIVTWVLLGLPALSAAESDGVFAIIDGEAIAIGEFERFVYSESRQTFYHGSPLDEQGAAEFRQKAADEFIDRKLKIREAKRIGLRADRAAIDQQVAEYESRYGETERWKAEGDVIKAGLRAWLEDQDLLAQVDTELRRVPDPDEVTLRAFYDADLDKFTQPEQLNVSIILLMVPPSSVQDAWDEATIQAESIVARVIAGSDFAEEAREHSDDLTTSAGGDMGYVHRGTLGTDIQKALDGLEPGQVHDKPIRVLEGIVLVKLEDRKPKAAVPYADSRDKALSLYKREASEAAYTSSMAKLRGDSKIWIDERVLHAVGR